MRRLKAEVPTLRIPKDVWSPHSGESDDDWDARWMCWLRERGYGRGRIVTGPDGRRFGESPAEVLMAAIERKQSFHRWMVAHPNVKRGG